MHFVIVGSGRVGAAIATHLDSRGHSLSIIDRDANSFRRLPKDFSGQKVIGVGYDRDVLVRAGIEEAYAFASVTGGDNSNIISARVAREVFNVKRVVARIYDPLRAEVYQRLGIPTVSTVRRTTQSMLSHMLPLPPEVLAVEETGRLHLLKAVADISWIGYSIAQLQDELQVRVAYLNRFGAIRIACDDLVIQETDELYVYCEVERSQIVERALTRKIVEEE